MLNKQDEAEKLIVVLENRYPEREEVINYRKSLLMAVKKDYTSALRFFEESGSERPARIILYSIIGKKDEALALMQDLQVEEGKNITITPMEAVKPDSNVMFPIPVVASCTNHISVIPYRFMSGINMRSFPMYSQ